MEKEGLLSYWPRISWKRYQHLLHVFGSLETVWRASTKDLQKLAWKPESIQDFVKWRSSINESVLEKDLEKQNIRCIGSKNSEYPEALAHIADPPLALFVRGVLPQLPYVAVVGTRRCTNYGTRVTETLVKGLVPYNACIVSGLAFGIDAVAHRACLHAGGKTIAVLGGTVEKNAIHPQSHTRLAQHIIEQGGALISEFPPGYAVQKQSFVIRNRIIAGLSCATIVTEAPKKSGALITAECALEAGRDVFAVPHTLYNDMGAGCNELLRQGAYIALGADHIADQLGLQISKDHDSTIAAYHFSEEEKQIIKTLSKEPTPIDTLSQLLVSSPAELASTLMQLEMKKVVKNTGSMEYILI